MRVDQDLSGDMIKVVQYYIVIAVTGFEDDAAVSSQPNTVAFGDSMTGEDFVSWIISISQEEIDDLLDKAKEQFGFGKEKMRKYLRVAFNVISRFNSADLKWKQLQATSAAKIAHNTKPPLHVVQNSPVPQTPSGSSDVQPITSGSPDVQPKKAIEILEGVEKKLAESGSGVKKSEVGALKKEVKSAIQALQ